MDKEKLNARELTEKEMKQVSGGNITPGGGQQAFVCCNWISNDLPCNISTKGHHPECATCRKNN